MIIIKPIISILAMLTGMSIDLILTILSIGYYEERVSVSDRLGWRLYCKITEKL